MHGIKELQDGFVGMAISEGGLRRLTLPQPSRDDALAALWGDATPQPLCDDPSFASLAERLDGYYAGAPTDFSDIPLDLDGCTAFQRRVLQAVRAIPRGQVMSYRDVAASVGNPHAARAVGGVMASNPVCVIIPCHRVVASDGSMGGFGGGLEMKRRMLALERAAAIVRR